MKPIRTLTAYALTALILVIVAASAGCGASARQSTIQGMYVTDNVLEGTLRTYAHAHTEDIIAHATSQAQRDKDVADWRAKVDEAEKLVIAVYQAVDAAQLLNDDHSLNALLQVAGKLEQMLKTMGVIK